MCSEPKPLRPSRWSQQRTEQIADCRVFEVRRHDLRRDRDGKEGSFYVIHAGDWVNVVGTTTNDEILLVRQYRYGIGDFTWEVPGGVIERGEDSVAAGERELQEETGFIGSGARKIGVCRPNPAIFNNTCHFVSIDKIREDHPTDWDEHEEIETKLVPVDEVLAMLRQGAFSHAMTQAALLHFFIDRDQVGSPAPR